MFLELLIRLSMLDVNWFISLVMNNLFFLFGFTAMMYYFMQGQKTIRGMMMIAFVMFAVQDFELASGGAIIHPSFLAVHYIAKFAILLFAEANEFLSKYLIVINDVEYVVVFFFFNIFVGG